MREGGTFQCALEHDGTADELSLLQLSVISAPVIGGSLGLNVRGPYPDDHRLDVIAVEDVPPAKILRAGLFLPLGFDTFAGALRVIIPRRSQGTVRARRRVTCARASSGVKTGSWAPGHGRPNTSMGSAICATGIPPAASISLGVTEITRTG